MTLTIIRGKRSGTLSEDRVPYFAVETDPDVVLTRDVATQAILDQALIDQGTGVTDIRYQKEGPQYYEVDAIYSESRASVLTLEPIGNVEAGFRYQQEPEIIKYAIQPSIAFGGVIKGAEDWAPRFGDLIGVQGGEWGANIRHTGIPVTPRVTSWLRYTVANGTITEAYEKQIGDVMGHVNSATYRGKPPGTLRFVSCSSTLRSDADMQITFGFDYRPIVPSRSIAAIDKAGTLISTTVPAYDGHDLYWTYDQPYVEAYDGPLPAPQFSEVLSKQPVFWYIDRPFQRSDLAAALGI